MTVINLFYQVLSLLFAVPPSALEVSITANDSSISGQPYTLSCTATEVISGLTNAPTLEWVDEQGMTVSGSDVMVQNTTMSDTSATQTLNFSSISTSRGGMYTCRATLLSPAVSGGITNSSTETVVVESA